MAKVRVWNDNIFPYKEKFKGDPIRIEPKSHIVMEEDEAYQFKGTFSPPVLNTDGVHMPEGFKMIRIEKIDAAQAEPEPKADALKCIACQYRAQNAADLAEHSKGHEHNLVVDDKAEAEIKARGKKSKAG